jgi:hypothetical protein
VRFAIQNLNLCKPEKSGVFVQERLNLFSGTHEETFEKSPSGSCRCRLKPGSYEKNREAR